MLEYEIPVRNAPFTEEPGYYAAGELWLYGNVKLLHGRLAFIEGASGPQSLPPNGLERLASEAQAVVFDARILVCGIHSLQHRATAMVPLRYGSPRIVVVSGGFKYHLGDDLKKEPFGAAQLWREAFDASTDLIVSLRAPDELPTFGFYNPTVDSLIASIAQKTRKGFSSPFDSLTPLLSQR